MSRTRLFRPAMAALAVLFVAGLALISRPAPALAGCIGPGLPTNCSEVAPYCAFLVSCDPQESYSACVTFWYDELFADKGLVCAAPTGTCTDDGRVNRNCSAPEIVYCDEDTVDFYYYNYDALKGEFDFRIATADLMKSVEVKTLVKQDGAVKVYLNPDGTVEVLAPQTDGKTYYLFFDATNCAPTSEGADWAVK